MYKVRGCYQICLCSGSICHLQGGVSRSWTDLTATIELEGLYPASNLGGKDTRVGSWNSTLGRLFDCAALSAGQLDSSSSLLVPDKDGGSDEAAGTLIIELGRQPG